MKIAVITPYYRESIDILEKCHMSVRGQTVPCRHVLVADGLKRDCCDDWDADHISLPTAHNDVGSTPRVVGSFHAVGLGFDAIAFLDADNWYAPNHIEALIDLHQRSGASIVGSSRYLCRLDGSIMGVCPSSRADGFIDTSSLMLTRSAYGLLANWCFIPAYAHPISDRIFLQMARGSGVAVAFSEIPTVYYRCGKGGAYLHFGETPPIGVTPRPDYESILARLSVDGLPSVEL